MGAAIVTPQGLTARQEEFCQKYTSQDREFFGNGVQSYIDVFDVDKTKERWYETACVLASQLLRNPKVFERINGLLVEGGLNDGHVDKEILFLINQHADFSNKLGAIKEYNKLKARITEKKDITSGGKPITVIQAHYGDRSSVQLPTTPVSASPPESSGQRDKESDNHLAPEIG